MYWKHYILDGIVVPSEPPRLRLVDHLYIYDTTFFEVGECMVREDVILEDKIMFVASLTLILTSSPDSKLVSPEPTRRTSEGSVSKHAA